jgi:HEPN domain-containing protein
MNSGKLDKNKVISYWLESADDDFETMIAMFNSKRYTWALFIGHLMIEKLLKAYFVKIKTDYPPYIHNLLRLAEKAELELSEQRKMELATITAFNINSRYDDYKMSFKKQCTAEYTEDWVHIIKEMRTWIKALIIPF